MKIELIFKDEVVGTLKSEQVPFLPRVGEKIFLNGWGYKLVNRIVHDYAEYAIKVVLE